MPVALSYRNILINFLSRITATVAFAILFSQIVLGAFMKVWIRKLGGWIFKFHLTEGALAYSLIILHPLLFVLYNFSAKGIFDPFYVFTDLCVLCSNRLEFLYDFGRIAFWLATFAVLAGIFRTEPWLRKHWRKFHIFNYIAFLFIAYHSWGNGTDTNTPPFVWFFWTSIVVVAATSIYQLRRILPTKKLEY